MGTLVAALLSALNGAFKLILIKIGIKERQQRIDEVDQFKKEQTEIRKEVDQGDVEKLNRRLKGLMLLPLAVILIGCNQLTPQVKVPAMPPEPAWHAYSRDPIVKKLTDNTFEVTDELVEKSVQQTDYINRVRDWKLKNSIP